MRTDENFIERADTLLRVLLSLLFVLLAGVVEVVLRVLIAFSLIYALVTRQPPTERVRSASNQITAYLYRIYRYLTYNEAQAPFPFAEFPVAVEASEWSSEPTESERLGIGRRRPDGPDPAAEESETWG